MMNEFFRLGEETMKKILRYLSDLEANNNREWYHANKERYQEANAAFEHLVGRLIVSIGKVDNSVILNIPKERTFRLARDMRFGNNKPPYNPTFRACISSAGKLPIPTGYFLSVAPGNRSFLSGGLFASMFRDATEMIRDYIVGHGGEWERIIQDTAFAERFTVKGASLKNVPRGYDETHPQAEYLKFKSWFVQHPVSDDLLLDDTFVEQAARIFIAMKPFNDYLNAALKGFQMPARETTRRG
jgi:uncharacterized protein (TIGR02453 family)